MIRFAAMVGVCFAVVASAAAQTPVPAPATPRAEETAATGGFLTPFPENDIYRIQVYGDGFGEGLAYGLADTLSSDPRLAVQRRTRAIGSLIRTEWEEEIKADEANRDPAPHVAVVMLGQWDRQNLRTSPSVRPLPIGSDEWRAEYGRRLDRIIQSLRKRRMAVYLVGQPVVRAPNDSLRAEMLNEVMRQRAAANGIRFIDIFETFQEDGEGYASWGPDITGNRVRLRDGDGFTPAGNRKIAFFIEKELRRDIEQAVQDRAVPLAGDDAEQRRLNPARAATPGAPGTAKGAPASKVPVPAASATQNADPNADQKADNTRVSFKVMSAQGREETVTVDVVRPPLSAAVIALVTRREQTAQRIAGAVQQGDTVIEEIGAGQTVVNSVSQIGDGTLSAGRRRVAVAQTPFITVLVKGERLKPRPGRADDFTWPRIDAVPEQVKTVAPAAAPTPAAQRTQPRRQQP